jgi:hypothetical protein
MSHRYVLCEWSPTVGLPLDPVGVLVVDGNRWAVRWLPRIYGQADGWQTRLAAAGHDVPVAIDDWSTDPARTAHQLPPGPQMRLEDLVEATLEEVLVAFAPLWD